MQNQTRHLAFAKSVQESDEGSIHFQASNRSRRAGLSGLGGYALAAHTAWLGGRTRPTATAHKKENDDTTRLVFCYGYGLDSAVDECFKHLSPPPGYWSMPLPYACFIHLWKITNLDFLDYNTAYPT